MLPNSRAASGVICLLILALAEDRWTENAAKEPRQDADSELEEQKWGNGAEVRSSQEAE